jgi:hypothetical protein
MITNERAKKLIEQSKDYVNPLMALIRLVEKECENKKEIKTKDKS